MEKKVTKRKNTSNKAGQNFEDKLQDKFDIMKVNGTGIINKVPTLIKLCRGAGGRIVNAFPVKQSSFLDFMGVLRGGIPITIEAKTTTNTTSFPFSNLKDYQPKMILDYANMGCKVFVLVEFRELKRTFIVEGVTFVKSMESIGRKSFPLSWFETNGRELKYNLSDLEGFLCNEIL